MKKQKEEGRNVEEKKDWRRDGAGSADVHARAGTGQFAYRQHAHSGDPEAGHHRSQDDFCQGHSVAAWGVFQALLAVEVGQRGHGEAALAVSAFASAVDGQKKAGPAEPTPESWTVAGLKPGGLSPEHHRTQAVQFQRDAFVVVVTDVLADTRLQSINALKPVQPEELGFERAKEAFHCRVVIAVCPARHTLRQAVLIQQLSISPHLVLPALIRMQDRLVTWSQLREGFVQHRVDHVE
jgi:hypothetical protein